MTLANFSGGTADTSVFDGTVLAKLTFPTAGIYQFTVTVTDAGGIELQPTRCHNRAGHQRG